MLWRRLPYLLPWHRRAAERDMQEELRALAEMAPPGELGNLTLAAEDARAEWGWTRLEQAAQDLRYAGRALRKSPAFTAAAIVSLAIGIGANSALFTLINTLLWKRLPVRDPEHLFVLATEGARKDYGFTYQQYERFQQHAPVLDYAAYSRVRLNASIDGALEPTLDGQLVTGGYFPLLGLRPALGRLLGPDDDRVPMGHPVAVLAHDYWMRRFGGDPAVVGRTISLSGTPFTIVGVAPAEFFGIDVGSAPQLFAPVMMQPAVMPTTVNLLDRPDVYSTWLRIAGRLRPGVSRAQAAARFEALATVPETDWRPVNKFTLRPDDVGLALESAATGLSDLRRQFSRPLFVLLGVAGLVLLIACANVANLLLARSTARRQEFAVRLALGASRSRLMRQVLVEGLVLAGLAGAAGVALAFWATRALVAAASSGGGAVVLDLSPDVRVLAFTGAVSLLAGLAFGSVPAFRASRTDVSGGARADLAHNRLPAGRRGPGSLLVVCQVAVSLVLLVGAGVFARSLRNLIPTDTDASSTRVLIVRVEPRGSGDRHQPGTAERFDRMYRQLLQDVERIPGVESATLARTSPLAPDSFSFPIALPGVEGGRLVPALIVYPRYFSTMGIRLVRGRDFTAEDMRQPGAVPTVLVNEAFVREFLRGRDPLVPGHGVMQARAERADGKIPRFRFGPGPALNIVGVVHDSRFPALREAAPPTVFQTFLQANTGFAHMVLLVRTAGATGEVARRVRELVQAVDPIVPMFDVHSLADEVNLALVRERLVAALSGVFAGVALVLVCVGLYGVLAFSVACRTREIGLRLALGATPSDVRWMVARHALGIVVTGLALGIPAALVSGRLLTRQLADLVYQLTPGDPLTTAGAALVLLSIAAAAGLLPALRAAHTDPVVALRVE
ncbi:MAG TPA: ABC transporter permease [Vicinamibacterales bacterium]|nr:ABC transporter permease [Vicinamibacterales bacterium]